MVQYWKHIACVHCITLRSDSNTTHHFYTNRFVWLAFAQSSDWVFMAGHLLVLCSLRPSQMRFVPYILNNCSSFLRCYDPRQNIWRCTGDDKDVLCVRWVPMSNVWAHEKTLTQCTDVLRNILRSITDASLYSAMHRERLGDKSALHWLTNNYVLPMLLSRLAAIVLYVLYHRA